MVAVKTEETLHHYLRRYFEKISTGKARQLAEQKEKREVVPLPRSADAGHQH